MREKRKDKNKSTSIHRLHDRRSLYINMLDKRKRSPRTFVCDGGKPKLIIESREKVEFEGKKIKLEPISEPILEDIREQLENAPNDVSSIMGIPCLSQNPEVKLFGRSEFIDAYLRNEKGKKTHIPSGFFRDGNKEIFVDIEAGLGYFKIDQQFELEFGSRSYWDTPEEAISSYILKTTWHELAHLIHYEYDMHTYDEKLKDKCDNYRSNKLLNYIKYLWGYKNRLGGNVLIEGIATWVELNLHEAYHAGKYLYKAKERFHNKDPSFIQKIKLTWKDPHSLGYWFVEKVSRLINANPIKLIIDHPPKSYWELFSPEQYVKRMKKKGHI